MVDSDAWILIALLDIFPTDARKNRFPVIT